MSELYTPFQIYQPQGQSVMFQPQQPQVQGGFQLPNYGMPEVTPGSAIAAAPQGGFWNSMVGTKDAPGWGGMALGAASGLASTFLGMQQYGLAKKTLEESKNQFAKNWEAQKTLTNARLEDRQRARVASNAGAYQSVGAYMSQNGVRG